MSAKQIRVSPNPNGGWRVHSPANTRDSIHTQNKIEAVEAARKIAQHQAAELRIQRRDGRIQESNSYGRDPFPPRG
ncbi:MAG: DUF2188 domain-containing protein [Candidatus Peribacteria bacterium]|jgi:hypothetical protein|nr:DUF2188 domain-containing protein [Candidatus Peribacteria bacterium]